MDSFLWTFRTSESSQSVKICQGHRCFDAQDPEPCWCFQSLRIALVILKLLASKVKKSQAFLLITIWWLCTSLFHAKHCRHTGFAPMTLSQKRKNARTFSFRGIQEKWCYQCLASSCSVAPWQNHAEVSLSHIFWLDHWQDQEETSIHSLLIMSYRHVTSKPWALQHPTAIHWGVTWMPERQANVSAHHHTKSVSLTQLDSTAPPSLDRTIWTVGNGWLRTRVLGLDKSWNLTSDT